MKTKNRSNRKRKGKADTIDIVKTKKEATAFIIIGTILFVGFSLFFIFFYRPFVPWKKIVCSEEGTYIEINKTDVKYIYEFNGIVYEKILFNVPYDGNDSWGELERNIIYINESNPTDVKHGSRGGGFFIFVNSMFVVLGGYLIGTSIYKFNQIKNLKSKKKYTK